MYNSKFTLCFHYHDTDHICKMGFPRKCLALDWFETFKQTNKRPVTVTLYNSISPCWVYTNSEI